MPQIDLLFDRLLELKGSDLHLGVGVPPIGRVRGVMMPLRDGAVHATGAQSHPLPALADFDDSPIDSSSVTRMPWSRLAAWRRRAWSRRIRRMACEAMP